MIIEKTTTGILYIPIVAGEIEVDHIILIGGMNEVDDKLWGQIREAVMPHKNLKEHHVKDIKTEKIEEEYTIKNKDGEEEIRKREKIIHKISATKFSKLAPEEALAIVEKTYSLDVLEKWKKVAGKETVRLAVMNRIEKVEKRKAKQKNKEKDD